MTDKQFYKFKKLEKQKIELYENISCIKTMKKQCRQNKKNIIHLSIYNEHTKLGRILFSSNRNLKLFDEIINFIKEKSLINIKELEKQQKEI